MNRLLSLVAVLAGCAALVTQPVRAAVILSVAGQVITDNGLSDADPLLDKITNIARPPGFFSSANTGTTSTLPSIDLSSVGYVSTAARGVTALVVMFTETDLTSTGPKPWLTRFSGSWSGGAASVEFQSYLDTSNAPFGKGTPLSDLIATSPLFALSATAQAGGGLFSVTEVLTITALDRAEHFSLDGLLLDPPIPEPASIGLLGFALVALGLCRRRARPGLPLCPVSQS